VLPLNEEYYAIPDFSNGIFINGMFYSILVTDNCFTTPTIQQFPEEGVNVGLGNTVITMGVIDGAGNEAN